MEVKERFGTGTNAAGSIEEEEEEGEEDTAVPSAADMRNAAHI